MLIPDLYAKTLNGINNGKFSEECSKELQDVITACSNTGKNGEIILTIKVSPDGMGRYKFIPHVKTKKPTGPVYGTIFWGTPDGNLQRNDPAQAELELRDVNVKTEVREVEAPAPVVKSVG
ncbi:MAG TPA: hypothetical protein VIZ65_00360 [Cellvibrionaceae bacterium]